MRRFPRLKPEETKRQISGTRDEIWGEEGKERAREEERRTAAGKNGINVKLNGAIVKPQSCWFVFCRNVLIVLSSSSSRRLPLE